MSTKKNAGKKKNDTRVALIGALATLGAAVITGIFGLLQTSSRHAPLPSPPQTSALTSESAAILQEMATTSEAQSLPTSTATQTPTETPFPTPAAGLLFATRIAAHGQAIDPGTTFPTNITNLYAVFPKGGPPPGMLIDAENQQEGAYYAFLKVKPDTELSTFGWRWIMNGEIVNEYITTVGPNIGVWLQRYDYRGEGIFNGDPLSPGGYTIVILFGGNSALSAELTILPGSD